MPFAQSDVTLAARLKALAHPARLAIVRALRAAGSCRCGEIVRDMPLAQSTVSQHLKILLRAGLIHSEGSGQRPCYRIDEGALASVGEALRRTGGRRPLPANATRRVAR